MKLRLALLGTLSGALMFTVSAPVIAQDANVEGRVKRLEKEMRAVQRTVFPNGAGKFFEPEIKTESTAKPHNSGTSSSAVSDLISRVDALEAQLATLTGQVEQQGNSIRLMDRRLKAVEADLKEQKAAAAAKSNSDDITAPTDKPAAKTKTSKASTVANTARMQAVAGVEKPDTGDAFEDSYIYGYRLWAAKFYPEAQVQLTKTAKEFPKHRRASFARNLLGRAYLDGKKPANAVKILYDNFKVDPRGGRAPESLYFLGLALIDLKKLTEACEAFGELETAYTDVAEDRLAARLASGRKKAKCS